MIDTPHSSHGNEYDMSQQDGTSSRTCDLPLTLQKPGPVAVLFNEKENIIQVFFLVHTKKRI